MAQSTSFPVQAPTDSIEEPRHPLGSRARVLLTSVFGPYARDDEYGSRKINPMELYHNQVTRVQGPFSLRMFHRSWGIKLIHANIHAPAALLDFPTRERFIEELQTRQYDIIGITAIMPNFLKVRAMCEWIRKYQPSARIVVGGHIANFPTLGERIEADHIVRGEGVAWFRRYLGQPADEPLVHPRLMSGLSARTMGVKISSKPSETAATLIPSVGCPMGCNFCATSAMFGGKGKFVNFYDTGDELFDVMCGIEADLGVRSFFVMDENFLLHRKRALRLLELIEANNKSWALYVFSSANVIRSYDIDQLVRLGISWVWMGLEGKSSKYAKLAGADTLTLVRTLQSHGIRVLGSSIIGMEEHTPENIDEAIAYSVEHDTDFHQFMLYTPIPGTPLYRQHQAEGSLTDPDCEKMADTHGQLRFNFVHPHIKNGQESEFLVRGFKRDFEVNGPSVLRITRTVLLGWKRYGKHSDPRVRARFEWEARDLAVSMSGAVWATRKWFEKNNAIRARCDQLLSELYTEFGIKARLAAPLVGRYILRCVKSEDRQLREGMTLEPPTFYEKNAPALAVGL